MGDASGEDERPASDGPDADRKPPADPANGDGPVPSDPAALARDLLERVRRREPTDLLLGALADLDESALAAVGDDRRTALAFWLDVYNAAAQRLLDRRPGLFDSRWRFFRATAVTVAGVELSLDDIEHGILRGGRSKYGLGYLPRLGRTGLPRSYGLDPDPRIHFALNCGAASCPAILAYDPATVDDALDDATALCLADTVEYDPDRDRVRLPRVCLWFVGDFGGRSGLHAFLREFEQIPDGATPSIRFQGYDWDLDPRKFADRRRRE
ncbi:hypothetical protein C475_19783 [Halosimplex carlsbadense 2-9-1]|uniref:DUF547 domain-containing protein n=1 Tax=Halosimplex carlsbadense 2-9-1 TaxID=797114 RepID=M0CD49_9EURY|nr:DUF547 domain-containing protein [Halosimplex carlsbadense]ELZ20538.1 hypothetical protein C475_19783 [Halosimplex carlsbadense 2-9-1]